ncbi:retrovirus-related pol polyprotein from transposon TNT 1-94 [Tanacetum coccineum]|uniref:Retrovirus-related pol polyprotein from transposon TNT 1-94 n=1 Tax=Tanacetum coccineum TaxID=301880 RepID=A0ABQ5AWM4_9ASTR
MQLKQEVFQNKKSCVTQNAVEIPEIFEINDLKARLQDKDKLKDAIKSLRENTKEHNVNHDKCELEPINKELENSMAKLLSENERLCNEINHVKQVFKDQFDSIKQTRVRDKEQRKEIVEHVVHTPSATPIATGMFKFNLVPLPPREIVEQAKAKQPLDSELDFACKYATRIQELLVYVQDTCPNAIIPSTKKVVVSPMNNVKKVRFDEPFTSSSNIKQVESSNTSDSNTLVLSSTGVKCSTSNCGSKPLGNKKNDRILQTPSRNKKHKVEAQTRKVNKTNRVVKPTYDLDLVENGNTRSSKMDKIVESKNANYSEPNHTWGSNATDIPSSSSLVMTGCPDCTLVSGLRIFGNDQIARIMGYGDYQLGNVVISRVYYVEGLGHNLFSVGQFCDADLEVAFQKNTCFIRNLEASKTKSWLWHRRLSHLNFGTLNKLAKDGLARGIPRLKFQKDHLCSACALGKSKKSSHKPKAEDTNQEKLYLFHMDLCGPMHVASINRKRYILVIVDDYSRFTWVRFLKTKDEAPVAIIKCIKNIQVHLNATVQNVQTDNGTEFVNQTLREIYENVGILYQTSVARTPQQNNIVERRNRTLVEAALTMLIFSKAPLFLWAKAINTSCYTQNRSLICNRYNKTPYELMQDKKPNLSFLHVFGSLCYPTNNHEDLGKFDAKADIGIFIGYALAKKAFRIYNKRTQLITKTIHVTFDELIAMASEQFSSGLGLPFMTPEAVAPRAEVLADSPVSISINQDAPSTSIPDLNYAICLCARYQAKSSKSTYKR